MKNKLFNVLDITPNPKGKESGHSSKKLPKNNDSILVINNKVNKVEI